MKKTLSLALLMMYCACLGAQKIQESEMESTARLAKLFKEPPMEYRPYVWWHWMGSNFSMEGIRKDLEAMKESGIAGATIFNLASAVQESHKPIDNNPWPNQTYRSEAYWDAIRYAAQQAQRLGLKIGLHNTPGYSTTGGPWITEQQCMQTVIKSRTDVEGGQSIQMTLPRPVLPVYTDYSGRKRGATFYEDIAVMAVPEEDDVRAEQVIDLSDRMDSSGLLDWQAPAGKWKVYRIGHAPTMSSPHPLPDDIIGKALEADKLNSEISAYHWEQMLNPLLEHVAPYVGKSFTHILVDSYEAGSQDWTNGFREKFHEMHGYDPLPLIAISDANPENSLRKKFDEDRAATINRMFVEGSWIPAKEKINAAGLKMFWEPYWGPFRTEDCLPIPDLPMSEYWTGGDGRIGASFIDIASKAGKNIIGAEAFTGSPEISKYTEDPAFLKKSADGAFVSGINLLFLHHWVHQPFDDCYQPGMGMGWWGTHFGRNQTWFRPGKAFMTYLARCQMMLRQGTLCEHSGNQIHRSLPEADIFFVVNQSESPSIEKVECPQSASQPELWDPYSGLITYAKDNQSVTVCENRAISIGLRPGQSIFVVFNHGKARYKKAPAYIPTRQMVRPVEDIWDVAFQPKVGDPFRIDAFRLMDLSYSQDERVKYFSGTATYTKKISVGADDLTDRGQIVLSLGQLNDIVETYVNGKTVATLWCPPYEANITPYLHRGENTVSVAVTNNWANRLIGDEQYEPDFEWGEDRGESMGRAIKAFPDWFVNNHPRPSKDRKTFVIWSYFRKDSPLQPAGLVGPVNLIIQKIK